MVTTIPDLKFRIEEVVGRMPERIRWELIEGELQMMSPAGPEHGRIVVRLTVLLDQWLRPRKLGVLYGAETGFIIRREPDTLMAPDIAFVRADRIGDRERSFFEGVPDLAVEVISPRESHAAAHAKAQQWLAAGAQSVWLVWPKQRAVTVLAKDAQPRELTEADSLTGEPALPGFTCRVAEIFE